jgi:hypothetical protein
VSILSFLIVSSVKSALISINAVTVSVEILLIWVDGQGAITSKSRTFVVLQLVTNVALIEYT